jgi:hypothetical protein
MADLVCVPRTVTLGCGGTTRITIKTSDKKANVTVQAIGFDGDVARINPEEGTTNEKGFVDFFITCAGAGVNCPASTTFTFFAVDYDDDDLDVECVDRGRPPNPEAPQIPLALAITPLIFAPQLPADQLRFLQKFGYGEALNLQND